MFAGLALKLIGFGVPKKLAMPLIWGVLIVAAIAALFILKSCYDSSIIKQDRLESNNRVLEKTGKANEKASDERAADVETVRTQREELRDAQTAPPATDGLTPRQRRGCTILRQQRSPAASKPPCDRLKVEGRTGVSPTSP